MSTTPHAPVPGDPRSQGPRPTAGWRDVAWATLSLVVGVGTAVQLARVVHVAATDPDVAATGGALVLAFVVTVVWLLTAFWIVVGAWRRTVWGCPFEHDTDAPRARRCSRHRLLADADVDEPTRPPGPA